LTDITEDIESEETKQSSKLLMLAILFAAIAVSATPILIARTFYGEYGISRNVFLTHLALPGLSLLIMLLAVIFVILTVYIAVIGPFIEEIFWRGCIQNMLERIFGVLPALLGQAVLFAAIHLRPVGGFTQIFLFGLFAGLWRWRRRTLLPIIIAHMALNSLWCAVHWPDWLDCTKINIKHDYIA